MTGGSGNPRSLRVWEAKAAPPRQRWFHSPCSASFSRRDSHGKPRSSSPLQTTGQDAALQSGHFNDFLRVVQTRSAVLQALHAKGSLDYSTLSQGMFDALGIAQEDYARAPAEFPSAARENEDILKKYLFYRALADLRRGWRVTVPNLEACALLKVGFRHLEENCAPTEKWKAVPWIGECSGAKTPGDRRAGARLHSKVLRHCE